MDLGMVSAATVRSLDKIVCGLEKMISRFSTLSFDGNNLLSCRTLDVGHLHSTSHIKHMLLPKKEYCRDLGNTMKESTKRLSAMTVYYYTHEKSSWYPGPEHGIPLSQLPTARECKTLGQSSRRNAELCFNIWICRI